jgi:hypothetical protein
MHMDRRAESSEACQRKRELAIQLRTRPCPMLDGRLLRRAYLSDRRGRVAGLIDEDFLHRFRDRTRRCDRTAGASRATADLSASRSDSWQHRGNVQIVQCFQRVQNTARFGRFGRSCTYLRLLYKVEGLVRGFPGGGSSPLGRMQNCLQIGGAGAPSVRTP